MTLGGLALCGRTVPQASFPERIDLAARHGFTHVSCMASDVRAMLDGDLAIADIHAAFDAHGLAIAELDALTEWLPSPEPLMSAMRAPASLDDFITIAGAFGATMLNVVDLVAGPLPPLDEVAAAFAALCDRAATVELAVGIEFVPWTRIPDLATALAIVEAAGRANGGVMLDTWHLFRGGDGADDVAAAPATRIIGLQVNDAPESERGARVAQATQHRLLPGDGVIGVAAILADLDARGCSAPVGCEVTSTELASLPPDDVAAAVARAAQRVLPAQRR